MRFPLAFLFGMTGQMFLPVILIVVTIRFLWWRFRPWTAAENDAAWLAWFTEQGERN